MSIAIRPGTQLNPGMSVRVPVQPPLPLSLSWDGTDNIFVQITGNTSDWNLSDPPSGPGYWTIEWWEKMNVDANFFNAVICQVYNNGIDIYHNAGIIGIWNNLYNMSEPTRGVWNHIALVYSITGVNAYINGQSVAMNGESYSSSTTMSNGTDNVIIGCRTPDGGATTPFGQRFYGQIANVRISTVARYSAAFTPTTALEVDSDTVLAVSGELVDLTGRHTVTNNGVATSTDFPA
jgi:hypothetical protein